MTLDEAKAAISENQKRAPYLSNWLHVKSGGMYVVKMHVIIEATLEPAVVYYRRFDDPRVTWCRPASEFFDGRFEIKPDKGKTYPHVWRVVQEGQQ